MSLATTRRRSRGPASPRSSPRPSSARHSFFAPAPRRHRVGELPPPNPSPPRRRTTSMKRLLAPVILGAAALGLAACGSGDSSSAPAGATPTIVKVAQVKGLGSVLEDSQGRVLYMSD